MLIFGVFKMLEIKDLTVEVGGKIVLKDFSLSIEKGETHVLLGPNGSGKTSLILTILGFPRYRVVKGEIIFKGGNITSLPIHERVKLGIGVAFQHPPKLRGVTLNEIVNICMGELSENINPETLKLVEEMKIPKEFLFRDVNVGFSGGEIKKSEILQLLAQNPDFVMLDEPDSGVDVENIALIGKLIGKLLQRDVMPSMREKSGLIITHAGHILNYVKADRAHVMLNGRKACSGETNEILNQIMKNGYEECVRKCQKD